jgi:hypothetical protein
MVLASNFCCMCGKKLLRHGWFFYLLLFSQTLLDESHNRVAFFCGQFSNSRVAFNLGQREYIVNIIWYVLVHFLQL